MLSFTYLLFHSDKKGLIVILCENMVESHTLNITFCLNSYGEDGVSRTE